MTTPMIKERIKEVLIVAPFILLFVLIVIVLRAFHPEAQGFEQKGGALLVYHASRLGLAIYVLVFCHSAGYRVLELFRIRPEKLFKSPRKIFILCFFFGATLYGIAFSVLGLAGLISVVSGFALTIPALMFSYGPVKTLFPEHFEVMKLRPSPDKYAGSMFAWVIILVAVVAVLLFLLTRVIFIPNVDGNIWEHYLHYYRSVLASGSTQPNEVWHHFYNSKGGGLAFLVNVLSDFFGVQIVSACFLGVSGLIILDLLYKYCRSMSWAIFGTILFFIFLYGDVASGALFRVHAVILGYVSFVLWGSVYLQHVKERQYKALMAVLVVALIYLGFYLPVTTALFPATFFLLVLINVAFHNKSHFFSFLTLASAVCVGTMLALGVNVVLTGLAEVTPMRWFWAIADQAKVERIFGTGGIEFFLAVNNDLMHHERWYRLVGSAMRRPVHMPIMWLSLLVAVVVLFQISRRYATHNILFRPEKFLVQLSAFFIPLGAFALLVPSPSVSRMGLYSIVFVIMAIVVVWKRFSDISFGFRFSKAVTAVIMIVAVVSTFTLATKEIRELRHRAIINKYAKGSASLKDTLQAVESLQVTAPGTSIAAMSAFRKIVGPEGRVLSLGYDAGYSYLLPGEGIISEPTYSLVRNPTKMLAEKSDEIADYLKGQNIKYFALNLQSRLFSTLAFTSLFDPRVMNKYFNVAYEDGDFFILTWRVNVQDKPLPIYFLTLYDLKRSGVLNYPYSERFKKLLSGNSDHLISTLEDFDKAREEFLGDLDKILVREMLPQVFFGESKALLQRVFQSGKGAVDQADPSEIVIFKNLNQLRRILEWQSNNEHVRLGEKIMKRELRARFVDFFRDAIQKEYEVEMGKEMASLSQRCDERVPFAINYPVGAACR